MGLTLGGTLCAVASETITINDKQYDVTTLADRDLGPGVRYTRLRLPGYPLNVNMLRIDVTNPYNSVEVTQANDKLYGTELLVNAAKRQSAPGHQALAGANANFWCVSGQPPYSDQMVGVTYNGNLRNGKVITETNSKADQYNGGLTHTGIVGISTDRKVYSSNKFSWYGEVVSDKTGTTEIYQCNKIVRDEEIGLYNSYYGTTRTFRCCDMAVSESDGKNHFTVIPNCATEVYLTLDAGQEWSAGGVMTFTVKDVKTQAGDGKLGSYDLALVGRGSKATLLAALAAGDKVNVRYTWRDPDGNDIQMNNLIGGNAQVMVNNTLTKYNTSETYNSQVYSRTGYGCDADGKTLYVIVIDKATDPVYGTSAGCSTTVMCAIAQHYGCVSMTNFDAGGSAEMLVGDKIINKTTESAPRAVANGMLAYNIAPADTKVARLEFYDYELKSPIYATSSPRVIAYNQYGGLIDDDVKGVTFSCPAEAGSCDGNAYTAGGTGMVSTLTATLDGVSVTKPITIVQTQLSLRIKPILIDAAREYPLEVTAQVDGNPFTYNPAALNWTNTAPQVAEIDADGVLRGLTEGTTEISGKIGDFSDATTVTVEIANATHMPATGGAINPDEHKLTYTSAKNGKVTPLGENSGFGLDYQISSTRSPKVTVARDQQLYSLPDALELTVNPGTAKIKSIGLSLQPANESRAVTVTKDVTLTASQDNTVRFDMDEFGTPSDLAFYPVTYKSVALSLGDATGTYHVDIPAMHAVYNNFQDAVSDITVGNTDADTAGDGWFTLQGVRVDGTNPAPGLYIVRNGNRVTKQLIR